MFDDTQEAISGGTRWPLHGTGDLVDAVDWRGEALRVGGGAVQRVVVVVLGVERDRRERVVGNALVGRVPHSSPRNRAELGGRDRAGAERRIRVGSCEVTGRD